MVKQMLKKCKRIQRKKDLRRSGWKKRKRRRKSTKKEQKMRWSLTKGKATMSMRLSRNHQHPSDWQAKIYQMMSDLSQALPEVEGSGAVASQQTAAVLTSLQRPLKYLPVMKDRFRLAG